MPNWCNNIVYITGPTDKVDELERTLRDGGGLLGYLAPEPAYEETDNEIKTGPSGDITMPDWYTWRNSAWGTKWEVEIDPLDIDRSGDTLALTFDSAWSPPIAAYDRATLEGWKILAYYWEPGMDFCGAYRYGEDDYIDSISSLGPPEELQKHIPDIEDEFNMTECILEWQRNNEEN